MDLDTHTLAWNSENRYVLPLCYSFELPQQTESCRNYAIKDEKSAQRCPRNRMLHGRAKDTKDQQKEDII